MGNLCCNIIHHNKMDDIHSNDLVHCFSFGLFKYPLKLFVTMNEKNWWVIIVLQTLFLSCSTLYMFQTLMSLIVIALEHQVFKHCKKQPHPCGLELLLHAKQSITNFETWHMVWNLVESTCNMVTLHS